MKHPRISAYLGDRTFYRAAMAVMIPVMLHQMASAMFSFFDSAMLSRVGELSMSAAATASRPLQIYNALFSGFTGAAALLIAQYHGAEKHEVCQSIFSTELLWGLCFSLAYTLLIFSFPEGVMRLFVKDPDTVSVGASYLRICVLSYLPAGFSVLCLLSLRAVGITFLPMLVSLAGILANLLLSWALILGKLGLPAMGISGAALAMLIARLLEMGAYALLLIRKKTPFSLTLVPALRIGKPLLRGYLRKALPLILNEGLWALGQVVLFWAYVRISEPSLPAVNIAEQISALSFTFIQGLGAAVSVLVGRQLGAGRFSLAKQNAKRLMALSVMLSLLSIGAAFLLTEAIPLIFPAVTAERALLARKLSHMLLCFFPLSALYASCYLLLIAGGDTRRVTLLDSGYVWAVLVPVAVLLTLLLPPGQSSLFAAMLAVQVLVAPKLFLALRIINRGAWLQNLTHEQGQEAPAEHY